MRIIAYVLLIVFIGCKKNQVENPPAENHIESLVYARQNLQDLSLNLYTNDLTGSNEKQILPQSKVSIGLTNPSWSADNRIYFLSNYQGENYSQIYSVNLDGTDLKRISNCLTCEYADLHVSYKTNRLVYRKYNSVNTNYFITTSSLDGKDEIEIRKISEIEEGRYMSWFPDGSKIIYHGSKEINATSTDNLYVINSNGSNNTQITSNPLGQVGYQHPFVSPDGKKLAYTRFDFTLAGGGNFGLYTANVDGTNEKLVLVRTNTFHLSYNGNWSKDSQYILVVDDSNQTYIVKPDGTSLKQILSARCYSPAFKNF